MHTLWSTAPSLSRAHPRHLGTTSGHAQRRIAVGRGAGGVTLHGSCRPGTRPAPGAPSARHKPSPAAEGPQNALSCSHHCLVTNRYALTSIWLSQNRPQYLHQTGQCGEGKDQQRTYQYRPSKLKLCSIRHTFKTCASGLQVPYTSASALTCKPTLACTSAVSQTSSRVQAHAHAATVHHTCRHTPLTDM